MTCIDSDVLLNIFTVLSHHRKVNPIFICHNLYYSGLKCMRTISLNTSFNVIMRNPRQKSSIEVLGRQLFPGQSKFFMEAYCYATRKSYSYLFIDSTPTQDDDLRLRANIFPGEDMICFIPNKKK